MTTDKDNKENKNNIAPKGEIVIYRTPNRDINLEVKLEENTVWLSQAQIANLFQTDRSVITKHLNNTFESGELVAKSNVQKMHIAFSDKPVKFYNLDVIISVGYRVNSQRATQFRIWATRTLKEYLIKGYAVNEKKLLEQVDKFKELQKTISFLQEKSQHKLLEGQAEEILNILNEYAKSVSLLEQYDADKLELIKIKKSKFVLKYESCQKIILEIKAQLTAKHQASGLFGQEVDKKFESIVKNLYQTFGGNELYASIEEKSAHLLYLVIKDHPFVDGNKRIASILFIYFLERNKYLLKKNGEKKINDNALVALALLIAISSPREKDTMIKIVTNLLRR